MTNIEAGKCYTVKEWFADKVANEVGKNISECNLFAVLKETEKAVYAMLNCGYKTRKTMWIPKSVIVEYEDEYGGDNLIINDNYEEVSKMFTDMWNDYN